MKIRGVTGASARSCRNHTSVQCTDEFRTGTRAKNLGVVERGRAALCATVIFVLAACGGARGPTAAPLANASTRPASNASIAWNADEHRFVASGLPAVTRDGKLTIVEVSGGDGGRGYPNVHVEVRDRDDRLVRKLVVIEANDWERLAPDGTPGAELTAHVGEINRELGGFDLVTAVPLKARHIEMEGIDRGSATGDGVEVTWFGDSFLKIEHDGQLAREIGMKAWRAPRQTAGGEPCDNAAFVHAVFSAADVRIVIVDIAFHGTDLCWEPADQWHVVTY